MLMSLAVGSSQVFGIDQDAQAVQLELKAEQDVQATAEVLGDLAQMDPAMAERVIVDEADLEATFNSIRKFVDKKNKEIDSLLQEKVVNEEEVARLAVELADAQAALEKAQSEQGLKKLSKNVGVGFQQAGKSIAKGAKNYAKNEKARLGQIKDAKSYGKALKEGYTKNPFRTPAKKSKASKAAPVALTPSMDNEMIMMNNQASDEVAIQSSSQGHKKGAHKKGAAKKKHGKQS